MSAVTSLWTLVPLAYLVFVLARMKYVRRAIDEDFRTPRIGHVPSPIATLMLTRMIPAMLFGALGGIVLFDFYYFSIPITENAIPGMWLSLAIGPLALYDFLSLQTRYFSNWHGGRKRPRRFLRRQDA